MPLCGINQSWQNNPRRNQPTSSQCEALQLPTGVAALFNKPDAASPAMAFWFTVKHQRRRVADLERWPNRA
jgi:hypothetical protein